MNTSNKKSNKTTRNKNRHWVLWVTSVILAFVFWLYVAGASDVAIEETYDLIEIQYDSSRIKQYGLVVQSISIDTVNVTIMGSQRDIKGSGEPNISAKISLDSISEPGEYSLPVMITTPDRTTITHQTVDSVTVKVDRPSEKDFAIDSSLIELVGWTLDSGCFFGTHSISESHVTVKGPTLELDTVRSVKVRTASIGTASDGKTVTADIVLLDANGNEINSRNLSVSENTDDLTVTLSVYMQKTVSLVATGKYGYFGSENLSVSPSEIVIKGTPDAVRAVSSIKVLEIDETKTVTDRSNIPVNGITLPKGITTATGESTVNAEVTVSITGKVTDHKITIPKDKISVHSPNNKMKALEDVEITVRLSASADADIVKNLSAASLIVTVDASKVTTTDDAELPLTIVVADEFKGLIYLIDMTYTVKVGVPTVSDDTPSIEDAVPLGAR